MRPETLEGVILRAGEQRFSPIRLPLPERVWREAVGHKIADRARPISLDRGLLVVRVTSSGWAQELVLLERDIRRELGRLGYAVSELRFRVGAVEPPERPPERRVTRAVPPRAEAPENVQRALIEVTDIELRDVIEDAARGNLAWQAFLGSMRGKPNRDPSR